MLAIIETGGKQYSVQVGDQIEIEKLDNQTGEKVTFPVLLLIQNEDDVKIGRPLIEGAQVTGELVDQIKGPKLIAYTYRRRKSSERKVGHRQPLSLVKITDIKG